MFILYVKIEILEIMTQKDKRIYTLILFVSSFH